MRTIVKGKNVEVPDRVRDYAERRFDRLERLLDDRTDAIVELSNEMHRSASDAHIADVTLVIDGQVLRSHASGISYQAAIDTVIDKAERQAVDFKSKPRVRSRPRRGEAAPARRSPTARPSRATTGAIVKTKRFAIEPMFEEDALASMEELGHQFFVFVNAETERVAILYERKDGRLRADRAGDRRRVHARPRLEGRREAADSRRDTCARSRPAAARAAPIAASMRARTVRCRHDARIRTMQARRCRGARAPRAPDGDGWRPPPARARHGQGGRARRTRSAPTRSRSSPTTRPPGTVAPSHRPSSRPSRATDPPRHPARSRSMPPIW